MCCFIGLAMIYYEGFKRVVEKLKKFLFVRLLKLNFTLH